MSKRRWGHQVLIGIDQLINTIFAGYADETLSARAYRCRDKRKWALIMKLIDGAFFWQLSHCRGAYMMEIGRRQLPMEYRGLNDVEKI